MILIEILLVHILTKDGLLRKMHYDKSAPKPGSEATKPMEDESECLTYYELLQAFFVAGCFNYYKSVYNTNNLFNAFWQ